MAAGRVAVLTLAVALAAVGRASAEVVDWRAKGVVPPVRSQGQSGDSVSGMVRSESEAALQ